MLHEIMEAPTRTDAALALERLPDQFEANFHGAGQARPRLEAPNRLLRLPADHWRHLRTSNAIESSSPPSSSTRVIAGARSKQAARAMARLADGLAHLIADRE
jgi:transposase-like protein